MIIDKPFNITYKLETEIMELNRAPVYVITLVDAELYYKDDILGLIRIVLEPEFLTTNMRDTERYIPIASLTVINHEGLLPTYNPLVKAIYKNDRVNFVLEIEGEE